MSKFWGLIHSLILLVSRWGAEIRPNYGIQEVSSVRGLQVIWMCLWKGGSQETVCYLSSTVFLSSASLLIMYLFPPSSILTGWMSWTLNLQTVSKDWTVSLINERFSVVSCNKKRELLQKKKKVPHMELEKLMLSLLVFVFALTCGSFLFPSLTCLE